MSNTELVIVAAKRTPCGNLLGALSTLTAPELASYAVNACLEQSSLAKESIDEIILGCVLQAGIGQAPARQAARIASLPDSMGATTINKMCGSGMKSVMMAGDAILSGSANAILCGGMESMSQAPYLVKKARVGCRIGHQQFYDHMFLDGLEDAYEPGKLMGSFAEETAEHFQFSRDEQDVFAKSSLQKALSAQEANFFDDEIVPLSIKSKKGETIIAKDEGPNPTKLDKISKLKPAFKKDGTVTAANSSSISDGAACLLITSHEFAKQNNLKPLAIINGYKTFATEPKWFTTAPIDATKKLLSSLDWHQDDVSLYEINEAFACVTMAAISKLGLDESKVNVRGGACALGHPIGASGARILTTLLYALKPNEKGVASLCIGGGEATAMAITRL